MAQNKITTMSKKRPQLWDGKFTNPNSQYYRHWEADQIFESLEKENSQLQLDVKSNESVIKGYQDRNDNLFKELKKLKEESKSQVFHWHDLFCEHHRPASQNEDFMSGYYSGRKDGGLHFAKLLGVKDELNQSKDDK